MTIHRHAAGQSVHTQNGQAVRVLLHTAPQGVEDLGHRGEPVALLHAQPGGAYDAGGLSRTQGGLDRQRGDKVGALGHVQLHRSRAAQAGGILHDAPIPLNGERVEPL